VLLLVEILDTIARGFVVAERLLILVFVELGLVVPVPHPSKNVDWVKVSESQWAKSRQTYLRQSRHWWPQVRHHDWRAEGQACLWGFGEVVGYGSTAPGSAWLDRRGEEGMKSEEKPR